MLRISFILFFIFLNYFSALAENKRTKTFLKLSINDSISDNVDFKKIQKEINTQIVTKITNQFKLFMLANGVSVVDTIEHSDVIFNCSLYIAIGKNDYFIQVYMSSVNSNGTCIYNNVNSISALSYTAETRSDLESENDGLRQEFVERVATLIFKEVWPDIQTYFRKKLVKANVAIGNFTLSGTMDGFQNMNAIIQDLTAKGLSSVSSLSVHLLTKNNCDSIAFDFKIEGNLSKIDNKIAINLCCFSLPGERLIASENHIIDKIDLNSLNIVTMKASRSLGYKINNNFRDNFRGQSKSNQTVIFPIRPELQIPHGKISQKNYYITVEITRKILHTIDKLNKKCKKGKRWNIIQNDDSFVLQSFLDRNVTADECLVEYDVKSAVSLKLITNNTYKYRMEIKSYSDQSENEQSDDSTIVIKGYLGNENDFIKRVSWAICNLLKLNPSSGYCDTVSFNDVLAVDLDNKWHSLLPEFLPITSYGLTISPAGRLFFENKSYSFNINETWYYEFSWIPAWFLRISGPKVSGKGVQKNNQNNLNPFHGKFLWYSYPEFAIGFAPVSGKNLLYANIFLQYSAGISFPIWDQQLRFPILKFGVGTQMMQYSFNKNESVHKTTFLNDYNNAVSIPSYLYGLEGEFPLPWSNTCLSVKICHLQSIYNKKILNDMVISGSEKPDEKLVTKYFAVGLLYYM